MTQSVATEKLEKNKMRKGRNCDFYLWTILKIKTKETKNPTTIPTRNIKD